VRAKDLSPFHFEDRNWREIPYFREAREHYAKCRGYPSYQHMVDTRSQVPSGHESVAQTANPPALPADNHGMIENSAAQADDSDGDSASKSATDSDSDIEMANTESRRTSVSNRGEPQDDRNEKAVPPAEPVSVYGAPPQPHALAHGPPISVPQHAILPSQRLPGAERENGGDVSGSSVARSLAETAKLIMANTSPIGGAPSVDPRMARTKGSFEQGNRRVEKIYAHSNPNRASGSPRVSVAALPERRADGSGQHGEVPVAQVPRVPSPASLQNILQSQPSSGYPPRPVPSHQQAYTTEPQDARRGPSPLQHPLAPKEAPAARNLEPPAASSAKSRIPSPLQMPTRLAPHPGQAAAQQQQQQQQQQQTTRSTPVLVSGLAPNPASASRGSTPVMVRIDATAPQDRWRAVRTESQPGSAGSQSPPARIWKALQQGGTESPRNPQQMLSPLPTPNPSTAGTQPGSPNLPAKPSPSISVKGEPSVGSSAKEIFDVSILKDSENPDTPGAGELVRLTVDPDTRVARASAGSSLAIVDPTKLKLVLVEGKGNSARVVNMVFSDGQKQTLVFQPSDVGHGVQNGFIHARRFCRWVRAVEPSVEYSNTR